MIYGTYLNATGISQARAKQDVIANNLANADTVGFRRLLTLEKERAPQAQMPDNLRGTTGGNILLPTQLDSTAGGLDETSNPLDLAIVGDGFLTVERQTPGGAEMALTRDGRLQLDADGTLTLAGRSDVRVLDDAGLPIALPAGTTSSDLAINEHGMLTTQAGQPIARLGISLPADASAMTVVGQGLFDPAGEVDPLDDALRNVRGGFVELSNVDPTSELTQMMAISRQLEANANMIRFQDSSLGRLIDAAAVA